MWRLCGWIVLPYFWYENQQVKWWSPDDPKMILIAYVLSFVLPLADVVTDVMTGYRYFPDDPWFGRITIGVIFLPAIAKLIQETTYSLKFVCRNYQLFKAIWKEFLLARFKNVV